MVSKDGEIFGGGNISAGRMEVAFFSSIPVAIKVTMILSSSKSAEDTVPQMIFTCSPASSLT